MAATAAVRTVSAAALLNGQVPPDALRDKIVVIGGTVTGGGDTFSTPFDPVMPGVEIVATAIGHLMTGDGIRRDRFTRGIDAALALVVTLLLVILLAWQRSAVGLFLIAAVLALVLIANFAAFSRGYWLSAALPLAAAAPPAILFGAVQLWLNRRQAQYFAHEERSAAAVSGPGGGAMADEESGFPAHAGAPGRRDRLHRSVRLHLAQRNARRGHDARNAQGLSHAGRPRGRGARRRRSPASSATAR